MKQIVVLIAVLLMGYAATAQQVTKRGWSNSSTGLDTITNAGDVTFYQPDSLYFSGTDGTFGVAFKFNKISGTPAGYAILQTSADGFNWSGLYNSSADSFTITNVDSAIHHWYVDGVKATNVRVFVDGSGTQSTQARAYYKKK